MMTTMISEAQYSGGLRMGSCWSTRSAQNTQMWRPPPSLACMRLGAFELFHAARSSHPHRRLKMLLALALLVSVRVLRGPSQAAQHKTTHLENRVTSAMATRQHPCNRAKKRLWLQDSITRGAQRGQPQPQRLCYRATECQAAQPSPSRILRRIPRWLRERLHLEDIPCKRACLGKMLLPARRESIQSPRKLFIIIKPP